MILYNKFEYIQLNGIRIDSNVLCYTYPFVWFVPIVHKVDSIEKYEQYGQS